MPALATRSANLSGIFLAGAPFVWEEIVGVQIILELLPSVSFKTKSDKSGDDTDAGTIVVSSNLEESTEFTRFDVYARFVKRLKVFSPNISSYLVTGWRHLSEQTKRRVFLPNLLELSFAPSYPTLAQNLFLWIRMFLSPSLISIVVEAGPDGELSTISGLAAKLLLRHVEATCYNLQHLQLFSVSKEEHKNTNRGHSDFTCADFWERPFFERLAGFQLQKLGCTTELVSPEWIHLLGEFSLLKSLDLYRDYGCEIAVSQPNALPRLEHFGIHFASCNDVETVAELGLLGGLKSLTIVFKEADAVVEDGWEKSIILSISHNSPKLTKLHLEFDDNCEFMPDVPSFRPLGSLPLIEVCLKGNICIQNNQLEGLDAIWPNVTRFEMWNPDENLELVELRHFVKLPQVQYLAIPVSWYDGIPQSIAPAKPSYTLRTLEILDEDMCAAVDVSLLAQYTLTVVMA
ncbi:hypothetical protein FRC09_018885 [Ceratobasidium sp. 395]|nr:hypothetical protein FRC09_018885 [Ceratobasidium sp. 395]